MSLRPESYRAAARQLRKYADRIEASCEPQTPRERATLTRLVLAVSQMTRAFARRHNGWTIDDETE